MEIIAELERGPRGFYTGALGLFDPRGHCELGLPIRTAHRPRRRAALARGGGIVVDSDADRELDECWLKTAAVRAALADDATALDRCSSGLNGRVVDERAARVSVLDRGLLHGDGVYDTWRTYGGRPFALAAHLARLAHATRRLGLPAPGAPGAWAARTRTLLRRNAPRRRRGAAHDHPRRGRNRSAPSIMRGPTILLTVRALPPDLDRLQARGVR
jgi:hypothetical protein